MIQYFLFGIVSFVFSFVLMEDRRCLLVRYFISLPHDNVLSQGGGPLAVEGVLLNSNEMYHVPLCPTPSVIYRCQHPASPRCCEEALGKRFPILVKFPYLGETDFIFPKLVQFSRSAVIPNVRTAPY